MLLRLPSAAEHALAVEKEHRWLPELVDQLPIPIPVPWVWACRYLRRHVPRRTSSRSAQVRATAPIVRSWPRVVQR